MQRHGALHNAAGVAVELVNSYTLLNMLVTITTSSLLMAQLLNIFVIVHLDDVQYELLVVSQQHCLAYHALGEVKGHVDRRMDMHLNVGSSKKFKMPSSGHTIVFILHLRYFARLVRVEGVTDTIFCEYG